MNFLIQQNKKSKDGFSLEASSLVHSLPKALAHLTITPMCLELRGPNRFHGNRVCQGRKGRTAQSPEHVWDELEHEQHFRPPHLTSQPDFTHTCVAKHKSSQPYSDLEL